MPTIWLVFEVCKWVKFGSISEICDIGVVLYITTIHSVIRDFDESEKVLHTLGGAQEVTFLTEKGIYEKIRGKEKKYGADEHIRQQEN